jgi:hypothetical protein
MEARGDDGPQVWPFTRRRAIRSTYLGGVRGDGLAPRKRWNQSNVRTPIVRSNRGGGQVKAAQAEYNNRLAKKIAAIQVAMARDWIAVAEKYLADQTAVMEGVR